MTSQQLRSAAVLAAAVTMAALAAPVHASGEQPILQACLAKVPQAADPEQARNHCMWRHWSMMAEYGR